MSDQSLADAPVAADDSTPDASNTIAFEVTDITSGWPTCDDDAFAAALAAAQAGGSATHNFFEALNDTARFWSQIADGAITFGQALSPEGNLVAIASSGNIDLRIEAAYAGGTFTITDGGAPPVVATLTVSLGVTALALTQMAAMSLAVSAAPAGTVIDEAYFTALLPTIYETVEGTLKGMAAQIAAACEVVDPSVDPVSIAGTVITTASMKTIQLVGTITEKLLVKFLKLGFKGSMATYGAFCAVAAVPALLKALAHEMTTSVLVFNLTGADLGITVQEMVHGRVSLDPSSPAVPGFQLLSDPLGGGADYTVDYSLNVQFTNSNQMGAIGIVLGLGPQDGSAPVRAVISVPWAGDNTVWLGQSSAPADQVWTDHSAVNGALTQTITTDGVAWSTALSALSGTVDGAYFYSILIIAAPA